MTETARLVLKLSQRCCQLKIFKILTFTLLRLSQHCWAFEPRRFSQLYLHPDPHLSHVKTCNEMYIVLSGHLAIIDADDEERVLGSVQVGGAG